MLLGLAESKPGLVHWAQAQAALDGARRRIYPTPWLPIYLLTESSTYRARPPSSISFLWDFLTKLATRIFAYKAPRGLIRYARGTAYFFNSSRNFIKKHFPKPDVVPFLLVKNLISRVALTALILHEALINKVDVWGKCCFFGWGHSSSSSRCKSS